MLSSSAEDIEYDEGDYPSKNEVAGTTLFVSEPPCLEITSRKRRIDWDILSDENSAQGYLSEEDVDWETLPLDPCKSPPTEFNISIDPKDISSEAAQARTRERYRHRRYRIALHNISMASYVLFALRRNRALSNPILLKRLKALIPKKFMKAHIKPFLKQISAGGDFKEMDVHFMYILKYLLKWLRYNYSLNSNGIRVLGYVPAGNDPKEFFPEPAPPLLDDNDWKSIIKQFLHNRDTAAHLLVALLRSLGLDARLVFSLPLLSVNPNTLRQQPKADRTKLASNRDNDLLYPYFWAEVVNPCNSNEVFILEASAFHDESKWITRRLRVSSAVDVQLIPSLSTPSFYPVQDQFNSMEMHNVILLTLRNTILDVSPRYMRNICYRAFGAADMQTHAGRTHWLFKSLIRCLGKQRCYNSSDLAELQTLRSIALLAYDVPRTLSQVKRSPNFTTISCLRYNECIIKSARPVSTSKQHQDAEPVYSRSDVVVGRSELQWKFRGRTVKISEVNSPMKEVRARQPRTIHNKRTAFLNGNISSPSPTLTKLFSFAQTSAYVKPIVTVDCNGHSYIPRNSFGDYEIYRPNMIPDGCEWLKHHGIGKVFTLHNFSNSAKSIQFVPVVTGFDFSVKANSAVAVKDGVLVLGSQADYAREVWQTHLSQLKQKQNQVLLLKWALMLRSLRIISQLDKRYGTLS